MHQLYFDVQELSSSVNRTRYVNFKSIIVNNDPPGLYCSIQESVLHNIRPVVDMTPKLN